MLLRLQNKFRKIPSLVIYYLAKFDYVVVAAVVDKAVVEFFQKLHLQIYASQFMTSQVIPL